MRRAALSIPLNIAEGYAKKASLQEFKRFLQMSMGSANEMVVLLHFITDLGYEEAEKTQKLVDRYETLGKRLNTLITTWR